IYVFSEDTLTPYLVLMAQVFSTFLALLACLGLLALRFVHHLKLVQARYELVRWVNSAWKLGAINGIRRAQPQMLLYILSLLAPMEATGLFRIAQRGASLVSFGISVVTVTSMPYVSSLFSEGSMNQLQKLVTRASQYMSAWAGACCIGVLFFGGFLLEYLFGYEFRSAYWMLVFCCLAELARAVFGLSFTGLNMSGHEQQSLVWMTVNLVCSSLAAIALVPVMGGLGAAVSYAVLTILVFWRVNCLARKILGIDFGIWLQRQ
ncbi:MAG: lipopolysaccharide biosynthesis protein, partial [Pseudomonadales bacterium]